MCIMLCLSGISYKWFLHRYCIVSSSFSVSVIWNLCTLLHLASSSSFSLLSSICWDVKCNLSSTVRHLKFFQFGFAIVDKKEHSFFFVFRGKVSLCSPDQPWPQPCIPGWPWVPYPPAAGSQVHHCTSTSISCGHIFLFFLSKYLIVGLLCVVVFCRLY